MTTVLSEAKFLELESGASFTRSKPRVIRVGLLGLGAVGQGLVELLRSQRETLRERHEVVFVIDRVLVRDQYKTRREVPRGAVLTADIDEFLSGDYDVVVEAIGGIEPAGSLIRACLERGIPVVSGNKTLLAERADELHALAARAGTSLIYEASVAAGIPVLRLLSTSLQTTKVRRLTAILNGTSNYILTRVSQGLSLEAALKEAQDLGFAEADPAFDLSGRDAAQKLCVLWRGLGAGSLRESAIRVEGIDRVSLDDVRLAKELGLALKPVAFAQLAEDEQLAFVAPSAVCAQHPLASVVSEQNGIRLEGDTISDLFLAGPGAGGVPTASAIVDDLLALANEVARKSSRDGRTQNVPSELPAGAWKRFLRVAIDPEKTTAYEVIESFASFDVKPSRVIKDGGTQIAAITPTLDDAAAEKIETKLKSIDGIIEARIYRIVE
ncbi:MAG: homoserine dehydrogenase [Planctomycetes bacterium]|nr:homoserine dehydrogenase [Planctomycetota bacterium]